MEENSSMKETPVEEVVHMRLCCMRFLCSVLITISDP